jgi:hypothetical protein
MVKRPIDRREQEVERCPCSSNQDPVLWLRTDHDEIHDLLADIASLLSQHKQESAQAQFGVLANEVEVHFQTEEVSVFDRLSRQQHLGASGKHTLAGIRAEHGPLRAEMKRVGERGLMGFAAFRTRMLDHAKREEALLLPK